MDTVISKTRTYLGDTDDTNYTYSNDELVSAIISALVEVEIDYPQGYVYDTSTGIIIPSPDETTEVLFALRAATILCTGSTSISTNQGIYVKDGDVVLDTAKGGGDKLSLINVLNERYNTLIDKLTIFGTTGSRVDVYSGEVI